MADKCERKESVIQGINGNLAKIEVDQKSINKRLQILITGLNGKSFDDRKVGEKDYEGILGGIEQFVEDIFDEQAQTHSLLDSLELLIGTKGDC